MAQHPAPSEARQVLGEMPFDFKLDQGERPLGAAVPVEYPKEPKTDPRMLTEWDFDPAELRQLTAERGEPLAGRLRSATGSLIIEIMDGLERGVVERDHLPEVARSAASLAIVGLAHAGDLVGK